MSNKFCKFLSNGFRIKSTGTDLTYAPCCWYTKEISVINNPDFDRQKNAISQINNWVPECSACKSIEDSGAYGAHSPRLRSFNEIPDDIPDDVPGWFELTIDTTCNAACIMCGPWHSTTWRKQEVKFQLKSKDDLPDLVDPMQWLDIVCNKWPLKYVKSVSFLGGEPFQSPVPLEFLKRLKAEHGSLRDVTVHCQTNGSIKPDPALLELISECAKYKHNMSIDAVGNRFEYLRYPLSWEKIQLTTDYIKSLNLSNIKYTVLATINPLNIWYYDELETWVADTFPGQTQVLKPNKSMGKVDLSSSPELLRLCVIQKLGKEHPVSKFLAYAPQQGYKSFIDYIEKLDHWRHSDWKQTFPDVVEYFINKK